MQRCLIFFNVQVVAELNVILNPAGILFAISSWFQLLAADVWQVKSSRNTCGLLV